MPPQHTRVLVTGQSDLKVPPDTAVIVLSVVTQNARALAAQQENARKTDAVIRAVREAAGGQPDIQTSDYSLEPERSYRGDRMPSIIGYEAKNSVTVRLNDLERVGACIDAATGAGANSIESVTFTLREDNPKRGETLAEASRQAMRKAESIAQSLGGRIIRVVEEQEADAAPRPLITDRSEYDGVAASAGTAANTSLDSPMRRTPVASGTLNVRSQVQLVVEIEVPLPPAK